VASEDEGGYVQTARQIEGPALRANPASFDDHFSQPTLFYRSLTPAEQVHIIEAFTFELGKVFDQEIKERELAVLANVDSDLCALVAEGLGLPVPAGTPATDIVVSPALSQVVTVPGPIAGRKIGVIAGPTADLAGVAKLRRAMAKLGAEVLIIAPVGGTLTNDTGTETVHRTLLTARSIEFDTIVVAAGVTASNDIKLVLLLQEAFRHCKALGAWGDGAVVLEAAGIDLDDPGVITGRTVARSFDDQLTTALGLHRVWARASAVMTSGVAPSI
jgi:catalase